MPRIVEQGTNEKRFTFTCRGDEETFKCWQNKIPRSDKVFTRSDRLCELHFQKEDIIRAPHIIQGGKVVELTPYERPKLKESAIPSIWPSKLNRIRSPLIKSNYILKLK